jgi:Ca-activated chloride channel family protein
MTSRILRLLLSLSLLLLPWQKVCAQVAPADDFFNSGAQFYISNNVPAALERVESGLKEYPDDDKLKKLEQLLKQQQQQQNQSQQQQQQQQQNQSQQQQKDQQQKDQQQNQQNQSASQQKSQDQQKQEEEKQKQAEQKKEEQQKQAEQQQAAQKKEGQKPDQAQSEGQPAKAGELTPEEANRLLDTQKGDEQLLQMKPPEKPRNPMHTIKDW